MVSNVYVRFEILFIYTICYFRISVGNKWFPVSYNPGLHARNRYGFSIYKHVQHWLTLGIDLIYNCLKWLDNQRVWNYLIRYFSGKKNGWQDYGSELHFIPCTRPGHQACLDQYETDGNIQFHWNELILIQKRKHFGSNISILTRETTF